MIYIDNFKHLYVILDNTITFPSVSLIQFREEEVSEIYEILLKNFILFSKDFRIIKQEFIIGQKKYYSFLKIIEKENIKWGIELRILSSYAGGGNTSDILDKPVQNYSPSFKTNKIYYMLFFYIIDNFTLTSNGMIENIQGYRIDIIRNYKIPYNDIRIEPWTVGLFDDMDFSEVIQTILRNIPYEWKAKSWKEPFIIERTTLGMNIIHPQQFNYLYNDFYELIKHNFVATDELKFLKEYFTNWEFETCLSKNGNLHWKCLKIPFL